MDFYIGQIFEADYPEEAAEWCNNNLAVMALILPISDETGDIRRFQIQTILPPLVTHTDLSEFLYQLKCKIAYGGVTVIKDGMSYIFETNQDSITMCNSMALALNTQPDTTQITWKVWKDNTPAMLIISKAEFNAIFSFGMLMINTAFGIEGVLNEQVQSITEEQLADVLFVLAFKAEAVTQFAKVNTVFDLEALQ